MGKIKKRKMGLCFTTMLFITAAVLFMWGNTSGFAKAKTARTDSYKYYTSIQIENGDTLWSIANEYMTPEYNGIEEYIAEVRRLNHLDGDGIHAGEYLAIPRYSTKY